MQYLTEDDGNMAWRGLIGNKESSLGVVAIKAGHKLGLTLWLVLRTLVVIVVMVVLIMMVMVMVIVVVKVVMVVAVVVAVALLCG